LQDVAPDGRLQGAFFHQIDLDAQPVCQLVFEGYELQQGQRPVVKLDQEIQIALPALLTTQIGAKEAQCCYAIAHAQLGSIA